ncbi:3-ketosteroid reductase [Histoplasma capsulatum G186AR]|uniref:3-ketosteroid reductase n=1 Tax=Ajellomyces capsulatus TaxID=5037 RepID=A0A8H7Z1S5_AJECA|nr:3-ketosteroid reductase [Histoplasma capsulatum]QSS67812.1 3-ketosteroid reductase [Histoplasma capsulatum G186AR]
MDLKRKTSIALGRQGKSKKGRTETPLSKSDHPYNVSGFKEVASMKMDLHLYNSQTNREINKQKNKTKQKSQKQPCQIGQHVRENTLCDCKKHSKMTHHI